MNNRLMRIIKNVEKIVPLYYDSTSDDESEITVCPLTFNDDLINCLIDKINKYNNLDKNDINKDNIYDEIIYTTNNICFWSEIIGIIKGVAINLGERINISDIHKCEAEKRIMIKLID